MRPYSPGGALNALASIQKGSTPPKSSAQCLRRGLPGYLILFAPHAFGYSVNSRPGGRLRLWCSFTSLRILLLHVKFRLPLRDSRYVVSDAVSGLSPEISHLTCLSACTRFTPNKSEQRSHPSYYRGCWHEVSRCFLYVYHQTLYLLDIKQFFHIDRALQPEGLPHSRGVAASGFRPLRNIPHCCLP